jgi:hypothetical protein
MYQTAQLSEIRPKFLVKGEPGSKKGVPIYRGMNDRQWFATFENIIKRGAEKFALPSSMLYYGPDMAGRWLKDVSQRPAHIEKRDAFQQFLRGSTSDFLNLGQRSDTICLVALGIGDLKNITRLLNRLLNLCPQQRVQFIAYDISFDMLAASLAQLEREGSRDVISRINGRIVGINDEFSRLSNYRRLMSSAHTRVFCLLGNTLGNEPDEQRMLEPIQSCMGCNDRLLIEVQLAEEDMQPTEAIRLAIQQDKEFYAGPFLICGASPKAIDLELTKEEALLSDGSHYASSYKLSCLFNSDTNLTHPFFKEAYQMPKGRTVQTLLVKKYKADGICRVFSKLGFRLLSQPVTIRTDHRLFGYFWLARESSV